MTDDLSIRRAMNGPQEIDVGGVTVKCDDYRIRIGVTLSVLAHNLEIGAALCRSFELGGGARFWLAGWSPGCGRVAK